MLIYLVEYRAVKSNKCRPNLGTIKMGDILAGHRIIIIFFLFCILSETRRYGGTLCVVEETKRWLKSTRQTLAKNIFQKQFCIFLLLKSKSVRGRTNKN